MHKLVFHEHSCSHFNVTAYKSKFWLRNRSDAILESNASENLNQTSSDSNIFTQFSIFQGKPAFFGSQASEDTLDGASEQKPKYTDYDLYVPYKSVISYRHIHSTGAVHRQSNERSRAHPYISNHCTCKLCVASFTCNCCYCANYHYFLNGATQHEYIDGIHASFWHKHKYT